MIWSGAGACSPIATYTLIWACGLPTTAWGIVPTRSTVAWFVYGSVGWMRIGESAMSVGCCEGTGVAVMSSTKPVNVEPSALATVPRPPDAANRTAPTRPTTAIAKTACIGSASRRVRSTRRWEARRLGAGPRGRTFIGAGRPDEGGRGRTWDGLPPRVVIGRIVTRAGVDGACRLDDSRSGRVTFKGPSGQERVG